MKTVAVAALLAATPAAAQDWTFSGTFYGWLTGMTTSVGTAFGTVEAEADIGDVLDALDMAFMAAFEARNGRWGLIADLVYADLSSTNATRYGVAFESAEVETRLTTFSGYATYRVAETSQLAFDVGAGFRAVSMSVDVGLDARAAARDVHVGTDGQWAVPLVAARIVAPFDERWFGTAFVDAGRLSGDSTWQALATVGYRFNQRWSMQVGYRYMNIETELGGRDVGLDIFGPIVGVSARF